MAVIRFESDALGKLVLADFADWLVAEIQGFGQGFSFPAPAIHIHGGRNVVRINPGNDSRILPYVAPPGTSAKRAKPVVPLPPQL